MTLTTSGWRVSADSDLQLSCTNKQKSALNNSHHLSISLCSCLLEFPLPWYSFQMPLICSTFLHFRWASVPSLFLHLFSSACFHSPSFTPQNTFQLPSPEPSPSTAGSPNSSKYGLTHISYQRHKPMLISYCKCLDL